MKSLRHASPLARERDASFARGEASRTSSAMGTGPVAARMHQNDLIQQAPRYLRMGFRALQQPPRGARLRPCNGSEPASHGRPSNRIQHQSFDLLFQSRFLTFGGF